MSLNFQFNNRFIEQLPADPITDGGPRQVYASCYSFVKPTRVSNPQVVCISEDVAELLGLVKQDYLSREFNQVFSGNQLLTEMKPYAMCYGGHQFGHWAGQLGDGRAINLGEVIDIHGVNQTLQLKGAGETPYSRNADGLAVLRSSIREFLCSEAMFYLGVPTTRALSLMLTGEQVMRDMFYDGNAAFEKGAVVCRVAPSFVRFGNFQIHAARNETDVLKKLVDYTIQQDFSHLLKSSEDEPSQSVYETWFDEVCHKTADMIVHWMRVGFVHGVMNTDNLSILGLTIDYGPYGWLEGYDPNWTPNTTDAQGKRYSYANQPKIAQWNLFQLANAISGLVGRTEKLEKSLQDYADYYTQQSRKMYANKLGLVEFQVASDQQLIDDLLELLSLTETDMTIFFRQLANFDLDKTYTDLALIDIVADAYYKPEENVGEIKKKTINWLQSYLNRLAQQNISDEIRRNNMNSVNPKYVLRNYLAQQAIDKANQGDFGEVAKLLQIMKNPYEEQLNNLDYAKKRPEWARVKAGCSMLSCSS